MVKLYYPTKITVDKPFASSNDTSMTPLAIHEVKSALTTGTGDDVISGWSSNYAQHAMAITLNDNTTRPPGNVRDGGASLVRFDVEDGLVVGSNVGASDKGRHKGTSTTRIRGNDDAIVKQVPNDGSAMSNVTLDSITEDRIVFSGNDSAANLLDDNSAFYLVAWFNEANDTGDTVTVHSEAYTTRTNVVLTETDFDSRLVLAQDKDH